jgi:tyrosine-protein kinase Etk/Wzc
LKEEKLKNDDQMTEYPVEKKKYFTLLDIIVIFLKWKKQILWSTLIICVISILLYFFVFDLIFYSYASIKSDPKAGGLMSVGLDIPEIGDLGDLDMGGGKAGKQLASYEKILTSRRCLESLIVKFNLMDRDEYRFMEDAIKNFAEVKLEIKLDKQSGIMTLGVYDKNPGLAKEMVEYLLSQLDKINIELSVQSAKNNREFIEERYLKAKNDLAKSEDTLKSFQSIYGIAPDLQVKAAAQSDFGLEAELKSEEVKLDVLKKILSPDEVEVKTQEAKISSLKNKISEIQNSTDLNSLLRLGNSPQIVLSFLRLQREVEIQNKIVAFLLPLLEQAKIEEKKETPTILVLDKPYVSERKSKPKRLTMVLLISFSGFVVSIAVFGFIDKWKLLKTNFQNISKENK